MLDPADFYRALREIEPTSVEELVRKALADGHSPPEVLNAGLIAGMGHHRAGVQGPRALGSRCPAGRPKHEAGFGNPEASVLPGGPEDEREGHPGNGQGRYPRYRKESGRHHDVGFRAGGRRPGGRRPRGKISGRRRKKARPASSGFRLSSPRP